jgi:hypothetical protein
MTEHLARVGEREEPGVATSLVGLVEAGDLDAALALNRQVAAEMPYLDVVEDWFVYKITAEWGKPRGEQATRVWADARIGADPRGKVASLKTRDWWRARQAELIAVLARAEQITEQLVEPTASEPDPAAQLDHAITAKSEPPKAKAEAEPEKLEPEPQAEPETIESEPVADPAAALPMVIPPAPAIGDIWGQALAEMNRSHAVIESVGGKTVIASWEPSAKDDNRMELVYQTKESFLLRYSNKFISYPIPDMRGGAKTQRIPVGSWWLNNPDRRQFRGVVFRPGAPPQVNNCLNLWQGWGVEDREGDWGLVWDHIVKVICDGNEEFAHYVLQWIAWSIQHPNAQAEVALVLIGQKGTGKGTLVRCLERIFKPHSFQVSDREDVIGKFNGHLEDVVLFIADEAYCAVTSDVLAGCRE